MPHANAVQCRSSILSSNFSPLMHIPEQIAVLLHSCMSTTTLVIDRNYGHYSELSPQLSKPNCDGLQAVGTVMRPPTTHSIVQLGQ